MTDREIIGAIFVVLGLIVLGIVFALYYLILVRIQATEFMFFLFYMWLIVGITIALVKEKILGYEKRIKA